MKKIIIYSDILRAGEWIKSETIPIIKKLLEYQLISLGYEVITIYDAGFSCEKFLFLNKNLSYPQFYQELSFQEKQNLWIEAMCKDPTDEAKEYLSSFFKDSIGISYHSSHYINNILDDQGITYLDFFETSYRYLNDTYFSVSTNNKQISEALLKNYALNKNKLHIQANFLTAFFIRNSPALYLEPNSALIVCQSQLDIVLIKKDGSIDSLLNYKKQIQEIAKNHNILYYKLHPYADERYNQELREFFHTIDNSKELDGDIYKILADEKLKLVAGINSGVLYEAEFFNKQIQFFGEKYYNYHINQYSADNHNNIFIILKSNKYIFDSIFWDNILHNKDNELSKDDIFDNYNDRIRNLLKVHSSYSLSSYQSIVKAKSDIVKDESLQSHYIENFNNLTIKLKKMKSIIRKTNRFIAFLLLLIISFYLYFAITQ